MNKNILIPPLIIAVSIIVATIAYLYFNPQARCERNNVKTITYNLLKDNTDLKKLNKIQKIRVKNLAYEKCLGKYIK